MRVTTAFPAEAKLCLLRVRSIIEKSSDKLHTDHTLQEKEFFAEQVTTCFMERP